LTFDGTVKLELSDIRPDHRVRSSATIARDDNAPLADLDDACSGSRANGQAFMPQLAATKIHPISQEPCQPVDARLLISGLYSAGLQSAGAAFFFPLTTG